MRTHPPRADAGIHDLYRAEEVRRVPAAHHVEVAMACGACMAAPLVQHAGCLMWHHIERDESLPTFKRMQIGKQQAQWVGVTATPCPIAL